jgi:hypothetical protein
MACHCRGLDQSQNGPDHVGFMAENVTLEMILQMHSFLLQGSGMGGPCKVAVARDLGLVLPSLILHVIT